MGLFSSQLSTKSMVPLCRQLATADNAGIPIIKSLEIVSNSMRQPRVQRVLQAMIDDIMRGATLEDAARRQRAALPMFFIELLASGEKSGKLDVMLNDLADYYEDRLSMNRRLVGMMVYPVIQIIAAWFLGSFALMLIGRLNFKVQSFNFSSFIQEYLTLQGGMLGAVFIGFIVCIILSRMGLLGYVWGAFTTKIWPVSILTQKFALARFFRSMSLLIGTHLNIMQIIERSAATIINPYIERDLLQAVPMVARGATLSQAFSGVRSLSPMAREMIRVGEESGSMDVACRKVAQYHFEEANQAASTLTKVLGVLILLTLACLVGFVVISFYSKYFSMLDSIG